MWCCPDAHIPTHQVRHVQRRVTSKQGVRVPASRHRWSCGEALPDGASGGRGTSSSVGDTVSSERQHTNAGRGEVVGCIAAPHRAVTQSAKLAGLPKPRSEPIARAKPASPHATSIQDAFGASCCTVSPSLRYCNRTPGERLVPGAGMCSTDNDRSRTAYLQNSSHPREVGGQTPAHNVDWRWLAVVGGGGRATSTHRPTL